MIIRFGVIAAEQHFGDQGDFFILKLSWGNIIAAKIAPAVLSQHLF